MRVVVAEDDVPLCYAICRAFEASGFQVSGYHNSLRAWEAVADGNTLHLLIADIVFPAGQPNGLALMRHTLQHHPKAAVIFITGDSEAARHLQDQPYLLLTKPLSLPVVVAAAQKAIAEAAYPPAV